MSFREDLKKVSAIYPDLSSESCRDAVNIFNILEASFGRVDHAIFKKALDMRTSVPLDNANDYYYLVLNAVRSKEPIKKVAYPILMGALSEEHHDQYDLDSWSDLVYQIYDSVSKGDMNFENSLDYYSNYLDSKTDEDKKFKRWVKYYKDGEHLKYNKSIGDNMKKEADFQFPLAGSGYYPSEHAPSRKNLREEKSREQFSDWKTKLNGAIRRIDKLLRISDEFLDPDMHKELADLLHSFDMEVRRVRLESTASDLAYRTAENFKRLGFSEGSEVLHKFSQEAAPPVEDFEPEDIIPPEELDAPIEEEPLLDDIPMSDEPPTEVEGLTPGGAISGATGPSPGEYEALEGDISLEMASRKLETIAGRLADRRTIRQLAEFDIMLDKLGIAAMFPELAESQSKLIDAYSYSLTRVTKMLGMLSSGKELSEISEAKQNEIDERTMKEVNKTFEAGATPDEGPRGEEAIREDLEAIPEEAEVPTPELGPERPV
jgi:hypothetical protein